MNVFPFDVMVPLRVLVPFWMVNVDVVMVEESIGRLNVTLISVFLIMHIALLTGVAASTKRVPFVSISSLFLQEVIRMVLRMVKPKNFLNVCMFDCLAANGFPQRTKVKQFGSKFIYYIIHSLCSLNFTFNIE